jgi:chromosomal replication initiation ATPase DnaA
MKETQHRQGSGERVHINESHPLVTDYNVVILLNSYYIYNKNNNQVDLFFKDPNTADQVKKQYLEKLHDYFDAEVAILVETDSQSPVPITKYVKVSEKDTLDDDVKKSFAKEKGINRFGIKYYRQEFVDSPYVIGKSNIHANSACLNIIDNPDAKTVFIYGPPGTGKSHLLENFAFHQSKKKLNIYFQNGNGFLDDVGRYFSESKKYSSNPTIHRSPSFVSDFAYMHLIIIDDIQTFDRDTKLENYLSMFFTIYEIAVRSRCKLIFSSDKPPENFEHIEKRIVSRFLEGEVCLIEPPDQNMKQECIEYFVKKNMLSLSDRAVSLLLLCPDMRTMKGLLQTCVTYRDLGNEDQIEAILEQTFERKSSTEMRDGNTIFNQVRRIISDYFGINENDRKSNEKRKPRDVAKSDNIIYYILQDHISPAILRKKLNIPVKHHKECFERGKGFYQEIEDKALKNKITAVLS